MDYKMTDQIINLIEELVNLLAVDETDVRLAEQSTALLLQLCPFHVQHHHDGH